MSEDKLCPFCGKNKLEAPQSCVCNSETLMRMTRADWDKRPIEDALQLEINNLKELVEKGNFAIGENCDLRRQIDRLKASINIQEHIIKQVRDVLTGTGFAVRFIDGKAILSGRGVEHYPVPPVPAEVPTNELLPCPHCGNGFEIVEDEVCGGFFYIHNADCILGRDVELDNGFIWDKREDLVCALNKRPWGDA